nr:antibiotic biosynthesis monooxygenase [Vibrio anguillarum]
MSRVTLKGFILVPESELELVKSELVNHKRLTLEEAGCITFSVVQNSENSLRFD